MKGFLDRRSKYSSVAMIAALLTRLKYLGAADDSAAYRGAQQRRQGPYQNWLMVQGHTHVPAAVPGVYYNTGTWITTLVVRERKETHLDAFPFLLLYRDASGRRVEEYFTVDTAEGDRSPTVTLHTPESVSELRQRLGYKKLPEG